MKKAVPKKINLGCLIKAKNTTITICIPSKERIEELVKEVIAERMMQVQMNLGAEELSKAFGNATRQARVTDHVDILGLGTREKRILDENNIVTIGQLILKSRSDLSRMRDMGAISVKRIESALALKKRYLGQQLTEEEWKEMPR